MLLALAALALATDRPVLGDEACPVAGVRAGVPVTPGCDGVVLSLARARWYGELVPWADEQAVMRKLEAAACAADIERVAERADYWRELAEHPVPALPPAAWFGVGVGAGVVAVLGGALAVRWASEVPVTE